MSNKLDKEVLEYYKRCKPIEVPEAAAEGFLVASGWAPSGDKVWMRQGLELPTDQAVLRTFREEFAKLSFILNYAPVEMLQLLIPTSLVVELAELAGIQDAKPGEPPGDIN